MLDTVSQVRRALAGSVPLIGFSGSPFTLACYMIEGAGSPDFAKVRRMASGRPDLLQRLVAVNARAVAAYLNEQIVAGADAVMLFDTWGGLLTAGAYRAFSLESMRAVLAALRPAPDGRRVPAIVFTKGGGQWLDAIATCGADCVGLDWTVDLAAARQRVGANVALQGNLDPLVLLEDPSVVMREAAAVVRAAGLRPATFSISGTASFRRRRPRTLRRWSRPCTANRAQAAPVLDSRAASLGKKAPSRAAAGSWGT